MKPGDYFVTKTGGFFGWCIRRLTMSPVNHAGIYLGSNLTIEAKPQGVVYGKLSDYPKAVASELLDHATDTERFRIVFAAKRCLGCKYNFLDIFVQGLVRLFGWHAPKWALRRVSDNKHLQCAQLVDYCY